MKRILLVVILSFGIVSFASAVSFDTLAADFGAFATDVAGTLASTASSSGLSWSPAYIGQFPHLGLGVSVGAGLIPYADVTDIISLVGVTLPPELAFLQTYGIPLPAASIDARLGGFILPFDVGLKVGYIPPEAKSLLGSINLDYLLVGADFRLALLKDEGLSPALSVSVGYTYFQGSIGLPGVLGATSVDIRSMMVNAGYPNGTFDTLDFSAPDLNFNWQSNVIEVKAQLSKQLLIFIPHVGLSAAYGISSAGGGLSSQMTFNNNGGYTLADLQNAFAYYNYPAPTSQGFAVSAAANGWSFRAFGGVDIALLFLHLDTSVTYNVLTGSLGGGVNLRFQL